MKQLELQYFEMFHKSARRPQRKEKENYIDISDKLHSKAARDAPAGTEALQPPVQWVSTAVFESPVGDVFWDSEWTTGCRNILNMSKANLSSLDKLNIYILSHTKTHFLLEPFWVKDPDVQTLQTEERLLF